MMEKASKPQKSGKKRNKVFLVLTSVLLALVLVVNCVAIYMAETIDQWTVGTSIDASQEEIDATRQSALALAEQVESEGAVLLQNNDGTPAAG